MRHVLLTLANFKGSATLGVDAQSTRSHYPVLDTGTEPHPKGYLPDKWLHQVRVSRGPTHEDANGRLIWTTAAIQLMVAVGGLTTEENFLACETLSVPCILVCTRINVHVDASRPGRRIVELQDADGRKRGHTAIVRDLKLRGSHVNVVEEYASIEPKTLRLAKRTRFEFLFGMIPPANCDLAGICRVQSNLRAYSHHGLTMANGIVDLFARGSSLLVASYRRKAVTLPKGIILGVDEVYEGDILTPNGNGQVEPFVSLVVADKPEQED